MWLVLRGGRCDTRCQILMLKCTKFDFGWGSAPDPAGGAYSAPPDPLAKFKEPTSKGRGEKGKGKGGKGRREGGEEGKGEEDNFLGWRGGLVVGRRTCDLGVAGSRPGRDAAAQQS